MNSSMYLIYSAASYIFINILSFYSVEILIFQVLSSLFCLFASNNVNKRVGKANLMNWKEYY